LYLEDCRRIGISGVHNFPSVGWFDGEFRRTLEATGLGYQHEIDMLNLARELDLLTVGYAFNAEDTERLLRGASPDVFVFHCGITGGGSTGDAAALSLEQTAARSREHFDLARRIQPDIITLAHGAAIVEPADAQLVLDRGGCHGVQLGSSIERLAIEVPLQARAAAFKDLRFP
jgi:predicted TIM-barrel enzyme